MGFGQALSGLNAAAQNLDVIGNNIANASTVGYKTGSIAFADLYASSKIGLGVQVTSINQRFTTGNIDVTGNQYDMAIDGANGFFRLVNSNGEIVYSRNGQFIKDKENYIVNAQGLRLTGYPADEINDDGSITSGVGRDPVELIVPVGNIPPKETSKISFMRNLDSRADAIPDTVPFNPSVPTSFTNSTPMTVYDSLGNPHSLTQYYVKRPAEDGQSQWDVYYTVDGKPVAPTTAAGNGTAATPYTDWQTTARFTFSPDGRLTSDNNVTLTIPNPGGDNSPAAQMTVAMDYTGTTSFGSPFTQNFNQDGFQSGEFASIAVGTTGEVIANYTNGETRNIGTLVLASFNNATGLQAVGGNSWKESPASGQAILGQPGSNGLATVKGQAVEASNVDMSQELVNMIIAQRTYQANAQTIKTQDQIMQTLMQMR
ncbi:flagellar hook protein FlgE [Achromobacter sp. GG226]|uniref:flagellar hook protein FlgE n=1 Tax=Verticiella alkaliphila TaxID=2779529 RepID=UPI001C0AF2E5|nr:flagellar hook protein FlgE [Verticiella sp. GG226]